MNLTVNGQAREFTAAARTHLADLLREHLGLTGTHLGCEQGVCGACTVLLDGAPVRACLLYAHEAAGRSVTTIEGLDDDPTAAALRVAFTQHHALQCGYCTPGMMMTARGIVLRLGAVDEARIREELAGNLCRCTGYRGIVRAVAEVAATRPGQATTSAPGMAIATDRPGLAEYGPARSVLLSVQAAHSPATSTPPSVLAEPDPAIFRAAVPPLPEAPGSSPGMTGGALPNHLTETQTIALPLDQAWAILSNPTRAASCLPGATLTRHEGEAVEGEVAVSLGPISARLAGTGRFLLDPSRHAARLTGQGRDGASAAQGEVAWRLEPAPPGCTLHIDLAWRLTGPLAQFSRPALLRGLVRNLATEFARNMAAGRVAKKLSALGLLRLWLRGLFSR